LAGFSWLANTTKHAGHHARDGFAYDAPGWQQLVTRVSLCRPASRLLFPTAQLDLKQAGQRLRQPRAHYRLAPLQHQRRDAGDATLRGLGQIGRDGAAVLIVVKRRVEVTWRQPGLGDQRANISRKSKRSSRWNCAVNRTLCAGDKGPSPLGHKGKAFGMTISGQRSANRSSARSVT